MTGDTRGPDFIVVGAMKAGTTTVFRRLEAHPHVGPAASKEPRYFSDDRIWSRGWEWYVRLFDRPNPDMVVGEASVEYTDPRSAEVAARRIAEALPDVKLIYMVRHPLERMASHYRHEVQRNRETRPFLDAVAAPASTYEGRSRYHECLSPFLERFPSDQILVVRLEDLEDDGWDRILDHLGLEHVEASSEVHNVTETKERYSRSMLWLFERGLTDFAHLIPKPIRRLGRRALVRDDQTYRALLESSRLPVPEYIAAPIWEDVARFEERLDIGRMWER